MANTVAGGTVISVGAALAAFGACELCARPDCDLNAAVQVGQGTGATALFRVCAYCDRAVRRLAAASSGAVYFVGTTGGARGAVVAPTAAPSPETPATLPAELIHTFAEPLVIGNRATYRARVVGAERSDGTWIAWIEFVDLATGSIRRTDRETSQPNRAAVAYWASGLQPTYLEGAFQRASQLVRQ